MYNLQLHAHSHNHMCGGGGVQMYFVCVTVCYK